MRAGKGTEAALEEGGTEAYVPSSLDPKARNPGSRILAGLLGIIWSVEGKINGYGVLLIYSTTPIADITHRSQLSSLLV